MSLVNGLAFNKILTIICCYNEVRLCGGCIYNLYVDAVVLLAQYVHDFSPFYYREENFNILNILGIQISTA